MGHVVAPGYTQVGYVIALLAFALGEELVLDIYGLLGTALAAEKLLEDIGLVFVYVFLGSLGAFVQRIDFHRRFSRYKQATTLSQILEVVYFYKSAVKRRQRPQRVIATVDFHRTIPLDVTAAFQLAQARGDRQQIGARHLGNLLRG
jgi:hypothetical protein